jgi:hypothetical protein
MEQFDIDIEKVWIGGIFFPYRPDENQVLILSPGLRVLSGFGYYRWAKLTGQKTVRAVIKQKDCNKSYAEICHIIRIQQLN